jgi:hypothetical protein
MPIINREKDSSEQRELLEFNIQGTVTGGTYPVAVPYAALAVGGFQAAIGLSGAPVHVFNISRFVAGSGTTLIALGGTITVSAFGTSGGQAFMFGTSGGVGSTMGAGVTLLANDLIIMTTSGSNAAVAQCSLSIVVKCLQDYKTHFGF